MYFIRSFPRIRRGSAEQKAQARREADEATAAYMLLASARAREESEDEKQCRKRRKKEHIYRRESLLGDLDPVHAVASHLGNTLSESPKALVDTRVAYPFQEAVGITVTLGVDRLRIEDFLTSSISRDYFGAGDRRGETYATSVMELMLLCAIAEAESKATTVRHRGRNLTGGMSVTYAHHHRLMNLDPKSFKTQFRMTRCSFEALYELCEPFSHRRRGTPGRKPVPFRYRFTFALNLLGVGVASLSKEALLAGCDYASMAYSWLPGVCDIISSALPVPGTPEKEDTRRWEDLCDKFSALLLRQVRGGREAEEEWRRRCAVWWGGMKGICMVIDDTITPLTGMPRHVPPRQAASYKHAKDSWSMSNLFLVDAEGLIVDGNVGVPGRAQDENMLKKMSFFKGMQTEGRDEWGAWALPPDMKIVADSGLSQRVWMITPFSEKEMRQFPERSAMRFFMRLWNFRLTQLRAVVEQCFGRFKGRWRILKSLPLRPPDSVKLIVACVSLHNWLERNGTDRVLRSWIERVRGERALERTEETMDAQQAGVAEFADETARSAQYNMLHRLIENSQREYENLLLVNLTGDNDGNDALQSLFN